MSEPVETEKPKRFFWKGVRVKESVYRKRLIQSENATEINKRGTERKASNLEVEHQSSKGVRVKENVFRKRLIQSENATEVNKRGTKRKASNLEAEHQSSSKYANIEGRRIVRIKTLAEQLICLKCKSVLSLLNTLTEKTSGLASIFHVECRKCEFVNRVVSDTQHIVNHKPHFDSNTKFVAGAFNAGIGNTHLNKILAALNIPEFYWNTFKTYEREVGSCIELIAEESCKEAALEERRLTIENVEQVKKLLPPHLQESFIFPDSPEDDIENLNILIDRIVRIIGLFDFGWNTKGSGRSYDSFSGRGVIIGYFTGKVIAFITLNRKCKSCDLGVPLEKHDCRKNFSGTAKAMESYAAGQLVGKNNVIFAECHIQVGIIILDDDSGSISAIKKACDYEIVKHSDKNHTTKGVVSELYKPKKNEYKELNGPAIQYLKKCFNYAVSQNKGDAVGMAQAIKNIPYHCYNIHDNCGDWCGYKRDTNTYKHSTIGDGFADENLLDFLKCLFNVLASRTREFAAGASTNAVESFNALVSSKAPKCRFYGLSPSNDQRTCCGVIDKNHGQMYQIGLNNKMAVSPGKNTIKRASRVDEAAKKRYKKSLTVEFKTQRLQNKIKRAELKNKKELVEGVTYCSNMGLLENAQPLLEIDSQLHLSNEYSKDPIVIFFDLETGGLSKSADVLQIAAKRVEYGTNNEVLSTNNFSVYITPTQRISDTASQVNKLTFVNGQLLYCGEPVEALSLSEAMQKFYNFLCSFKKKCILTAHNCTFDYPRLLRAINLSSMRDHFKSLIGGFSDTYRLIKTVTGKSGKGENKLETLARNLEINCVNAHDAAADVDILAQVVVKLKISSAKIIQSAISLEDAQSKVDLSNKISSNSYKLNQLKDCTTEGMRKKMIAADIYYDDIVNAYNENKLLGLVSLFGRDENGCIKVTTCRNVIKKINDYLSHKTKEVAKNA